MREKNAGGSAPIPAMALFGLILGCILFLTALGSSLYGSLVNSQQKNSALRASLSYLTTRLRAADTAGGVQLAKGPAGDMLVLPEEESGYETRIYWYEGALLEEYAPRGSAVNPADGQAVARTSQFAVSRTEDGLLSLTTGEGVARIALQCKEAAE